MATVPADIRKEVRDLVWARADEIDWTRMSQSEKARQYEVWVNDPQVGGVLSRYIEKGGIRVYLKDTLLKSFTRERSGDPSTAMRALDIESAASVAVEYIKPHGRTFTDGRTIAWGPADGWKAIVTAMHERTYGRPSYRQTGIVLTGAARCFQSRGLREMVEAAGSRLGVGKIVWHDD